MSSWQHVLGTARAWSPPVIVAACGILAVILLHRFLQRRHNAVIDSNLGVVGPLTTLALSGVVLVGCILSLPIGDAARGQLLSLIGLLLTAAIALSSTTVLGNAMAGVMLRVISNFRPGDFVHVGDYFGRVSETGLLHTEIQTQDRDLTTLPNLYLVTNPVTVVRSSGTIVSAIVSLGYDINRQRIERLLLEAAASAGLTDAFIQIEELGDFSISYRTAGFLSDVKSMLSARSTLRKAILDSLHGAKIEIVSPSFMNQRNVTESQPFVPDAHRKSYYQEEPTPNPEAMIFDKADVAEARAKLMVDLEASRVSLKDLQKSLTEATEDAKDAIMAQIWELETTIEVGMASLEEAETSKTESD